MQSEEGQYGFLGQLIEKVEKDYEEGLFCLAKTDLAAFAEYVNPEWVPARHHLLMIDKLMEKLVHGEDGRLIVSMPMGHGKSVYSSIAAPAFIFGLDPHQRIITAGHSQNFVTTALGKKVREIITSERYQRLFPESRLSLTSRAGDNFTLIPTRPGTAGHYIAKGAEQGISGFRATRIIADDLYPNINVASSPTARQKISEWFRGDLLPRLLPGGNAVLVITRFHANDIVSELLDDKEKGGTQWETVILPAICEDAETDPMGRQEGEPLWPEFHTLDSLLARKADMSARLWNTMYQCNPTADDNGIVKDEWLTRWTSLPDEGRIRRRFVSFDTSSTSTARSDWTVGTAWIETVERKFYLVDICRARVEFTELVRLVNDFAKRNQANAILVEDANHGKALLQAYSGKMVSPLIAISAHQKSKELRFDEVTPLFESGAVILPARHELLAEVERELFAWPNTKHDDVIDSISQALRWARGYNVRRGTKKLQGTH